MCTFSFGFGSFLPPGFFASSVATREPTSQPAARTGQVRSDSSIGVCETESQPNQKLEAAAATTTTTPNSSLELRRRRRRLRATKLEAKRQSQSNNSEHDKLCTKRSDFSINAPAAAAALTFSWLLYRVCLLCSHNERAKLSERDKREKLHGQIYVVLCCVVFSIFSLLKKRRC